MGVAAEGGSGCLSGRLKGAVDRELGGEGGYIGHFSNVSDVLHFCAQTIFLARFLGSILYKV